MRDDPGGPGPDLGYHVATRQAHTNHREPFRTPRSWSPLASQRALLQLRQSPPERGLAHVRGRALQVDVVLEVRDARIPMATAHPRLHQFTQGKQRLLIMNRVDQVTKRAREEWDGYYKATGERAFWCNAQSGDGIKPILKVPPLPLPIFFHTPVHVRKEEGDGPCKAMGRSMTPPQALLGGQAAQNCDPELQPMYWECDVAQAGLVLLPLPPPPPCTNGR